MWGVTRRVLRLLLPIVAALAAFPALAAAAPTLSISAAPNLEGGLPGQTVGVVVDGASADAKVFLAEEGAFGLTCTASPDPQSRDGFPIYGAPAVTQDTSWQFSFDGAVLLCGWVVDGQGTVVASASLTVTVSPPFASIAIAAPPSVVAGQPFQVTTTIVSHVQRSASVTAVPGACPATSTQAQAVAGAQAVEASWLASGGPLSDTKTLTLQPGKYTLCGYVDAGPGFVPAATAATAITVIAPCVVPTVAPGASLARVKSELATADCTLGTLSYAASGKYKKGTLLALTPAPGAALAPGAAVKAQLSTGKPCVVPRSANATLKQVKRALKSAHCVAGKVTHARSSRYARGRVVRLSAKTGKTLATGARVGIVVSSGA